MFDKPYTHHRDASLALLNSGIRLTAKAGQFLGQITVSSAPLSDRQAEWLGQLLNHAGLPHFEGGTAS